MSHGGDYNNKSKRTASLLSRLGCRSCVLQSVDLGWLMLGSRNSLPELFVDGYGVLNSVDKRGRCPRRWFATVMFFSFLKKVIKVALTLTNSQMLMPPKSRQLLGMPKKNNAYFKNKIKLKFRRLSHYFPPSRKGIRGTQVQ